MMHKLLIVDDAAAERAKAVDEMWEEVLDNASDEMWNPQPKHFPKLAALAADYLRLAEGGDES